MKLSEKQYKILTDHLAEKWKAPVACPVCKSNDWDVPKEVYELREFHGGGMVIGGSSIIPVSPVTCKVCGNTVMINPLIAGIDLGGDK
jgi:predicted Zn-ribbon and HTH transcriptional regulator